MKFFHLSHTDLDGYGCQLISKKIFPDGVFYNANYGLEVKIFIEDILSQIKSLDKDSKIFFLITDLNLTYDEAKKLNHDIKLLTQNGYDVSLQLLDHHGTGKKSAEKFEWYFLDTSRSATKITYDYFINNYDEFLSLCEPNFDKLIQAINAVDIWIDNDELFEFGKVCMSMVSNAKEINNILFKNQNLAYRHHLLLKAIDYITKSNGHILLDEQIYFIKKEYLAIDDTTDTFDNITSKKLVNNLKNSKDNFTVFYKGHKGLLTYCLGSISIPANAFLKENPDYHFFVDIGRRGKAGLRANNKLDVSKLASDLANGGGHPNASGCAFEDWKEKILYEDVKQYFQEKLTILENNTE